VGRARSFLPGMGGGTRIKDLRGAFSRQMGPLDLAIAILVVLAGIFASAAYGAISVSPADFRKARICFVLSAICIAGVAVVWGFTTIQPLLVRTVATGLIGAIALIGLTEALRWLNRREQTVFTEQTDKAQTKPDTNLVFECHLAQLPTKVPMEGEIATLPLFYSPDSGGELIGLSVRHGQPGSDWDWFPDLRFPQVYRCEITNYGSAPLLQVGLKFKVEYREVFKDPDNPGTTTSGNVIHSRDWPVLLSKIDAGKSNAAVFYIYNQSRYFAFVSPPNVAAYIALGEMTQREAALLPIGMIASMSLWPAEQIK
jgi:hypothetical protein